jgi:hypothetical protein
MNPRQLTRGQALLVCLLLLLIASWVGGQSTPRELAEIVDRTLTIQRTIQERRETWAEAKASLQSRLRHAQAQVAYLRDRQRSQADQADRLEAEVAEYERRLTEARRLQDSMEDSLRVIWQRLHSWSLQDLPFLAVQRSGRLASLRKELARPDVDAADKLRVVLETLQIEAGYGASVAVHQAEIQVGDGRLHVELLRIGRLCLFWRTPDGQRIGEYNRAAGRWLDLPDRYRQNVNRALAMAERRRPVEAISLPLGRIVP